MLEYIQEAILPLTWTQLGAAILCGFLLGIERQVRGRPAGIRTAIMICLGSEIFVHLGTTIDVPGADATRVLGQIVTGVGFLGAGVMLARGSMVIGVTSASLIWIMAAVGATIGLGYVSAGITVTIVAVFTLTVFDYFENKLGFPEVASKKKKIEIPMAD
ncbi:MAG TPA: MgtC/SapB family protein [Oligoflexia bacterium]|nr:MgtC/SapB family protein [Oligoflexia bacterium]HMP48324.1 MgtC/SapB family protein [Oligoflexia bacterium]